MAVVLFYEKPGCINNTKQKKLLREAGHTVLEKDLLNTPWKKEALMEFFSALPVVDWFNTSAPSIKSGEVIPAACGVEQALSLMLQEPLLIRRPLMKVNNDVMVGFDQDAVERWIGLESKTSDDVETCPRSHDEQNKVKPIRAES